MSTDKKKTKLTYFVNVRAARAGGKKVGVEMNKLCSRCCIDDKIRICTHVRRIFIWIILVRHTGTIIFFSSYFTYPYYYYYYPCGLSTEQTRARQTNDDNKLANLICCQKLNPFVNYLKNVVSLFTLSHFKYAPELFRKMRVCIHNDDDDDKTRPTKNMLISNISPYCVSYLNAKIQRAS